MAKLPDQIQKEKVQKALKKAEEEEEKRKLQEEKKQLKIKKNEEIQADVYTTSAEWTNPIKEGTIAKEEQDLREIDESSITNDTATEGAMLAKSEGIQNLGYWREKTLETYKDKIDIIQTNFHKNVPTKYNKFVCSCCGEVYNRTTTIEGRNFHKTYSLLMSARRLDTPYFFQPFCRKCSEKLFKYYFKLYNKDEIMAMKHWCCDTNTYWDIKCLEDARKVFMNSKVNMNIISEYLGAVARSGNISNSFWDSPFLTERNKEVKEELSDFEAPIDWQKEDVLAKGRILKIFRYDPFKDEDEDAKSGMYRALDFMIEPEMEEDYIKLQAAIEIVMAYQRIDRIKKKEKELERDTEHDNTQIMSNLSNLKKKEFDVISKLCDDQGFNIKVGIKKSRGVGTLTYTMNEMKGKYYEPALENYYDVKTSKEMEQVAEMSMKAIFQQIALSSSEYGDMINKMRDRILKLSKENDALAEKNRKLTIIIEEKKLIDRAKKDGVWTSYDEIEHNEMLKDVLGGEDDG